MINSRDFYLANDSVNGFVKDDFFNFQSENLKCFFNTPSGLGAEYEHGVQSYGDTKIATSTVKKDPVITGELIFKGSSNAETYDLYADFVQYLQSDNLVFVQVLPTKKRKEIDFLGGSAYGMEVKLSKLEKTEIDYKLGVLRCKVEFIGLSKWYHDFLFPKADRGKTLLKEAEIKSDSSTVLSLNNTTMSWQHCRIYIRATEYFSDVRYTLTRKDFGHDGEIVGKGRITNPEGFYDINISSINRESIECAPTSYKPLPNYINYSYALPNVPFLFISIPPGKSIISFAFVNMGDNPIGGKIGIFMEEGYDTV